jgi:hypothetical protein
MLTRHTADITHARREFEWVVRRRAVQVVFQPIVHIESGAIVGYEALARGPTASPSVATASGWSTSTPVVGATCAAPTARSSGPRCAPARSPAVPTPTTTGTVRCECPLTTVMVSLPAYPCDTSRSSSWRRRMTSPYTSASQFRHLGR